ncbi:GlsB/YeaQ/YmgE family stress response membrane protein [Thauera sp. UPWRP]|nr:GlsB/YeaQ/YmgE family stress response membrane protein [Thauera sp. UPWRP]
MNFILWILVGVVGALIAGWIISPLVGIPTINQDAFSLPALLVSLLAAIVLLGVVNLVRRDRIR